VRLRYGLGVSATVLDPTGSMSRLQVTGQDGSTLGIDPANIRHVYVHGRWIPYLVIKVVDPSQTRPPLPL
jgi:hypothetical protein